MDQAAFLRQMMRQTQESTPAPARTPAIVIGSGKGGVGKSVMACMTAAAFAESGKRVLLLEGDQNLGNLHILLGVQPVARVETLLYGAGSPRDLLVEVQDNLSLLPGDSGAETLHGVGSVEQARLHHRLSTVFDDFDVVVIDAGAGIESVMRTATLSATHLVMVTVPEPAALTDAYAVIKLVSLQVPDLPIDILVNRVLSEDEGTATFQKLQAASGRFLKRRLEYLGSVPDDKQIFSTVRGARRLLDGVAGSQAAEALNSMVLARPDLCRPLTGVAGIATRS